jgi:Transposase DDE domain
MASIARVLANVKNYFTSYVPDSMILEACEDADHQWRDRQLGPVVTTYLFLQQIVHGNTACSHLRHLSGMPVNPSAYCQARSRLPLKFFERLQARVTEAVRVCLPRVACRRWQRHRLFFLDGSSFSMPDTPELQEHFGQPVGQALGCGFPTAHLMALFDYPTGLLRKTLALPLHTSDMAQAAALHPELRPDDILVGDRAFGSYAHLALCRKRRIHGLFRAHQKQIISFRAGRPHQPLRGAATEEKGLPSSHWVKRLEYQDQLVEYYKPVKRPVWMTVEQWEQLPPSIVVRELRYRIRVRGVRTKEVTLVTTLLDSDRYTAKELARLYGLRWRLEVNLKHLKQTMRMDILRCTTVAGVLKELAVFVIVYDLVRRVMAVAAKRQKGPGSNQFYRRLALAATSRADNVLARSDSGPRAAWPLRATRAQATPQAVSSHEETTGGTSQSAARYEIEGLTTRHSCMSPFPPGRGLRDFGRTYPWLGRDCISKRRIQGRDRRDR